MMMKLWQFHHGGSVIKERERERELVKGDCHTAYPLQYLKKCVDNYTDVSGQWESWVLPWK